MKKAAFLVVLLLISAGIFEPSFVQTAARASNKEEAPERTLRLLRYTPRSAVQTRVWQNQVREKLFSVLKLNPAIHPPLSARVVASSQIGNFTAHTVEINSTPGRRIQIRVTIPAEHGARLPAVICIPGHGLNKFQVYFRPQYHRVPTILASSGYITVSVDVAQHEVFEKGQTLMGERIRDLMRAVDYIRAMPEADATRIGAAGLSLGGEMSMWLGAMDTRVAAVASSGFLTKMDQLEKNHCPCWKVQGLRELVDFSDIYSLIAPRPLLCQNGQKESPTGFTIPIAKQAFSEIVPVFDALGSLDQAILVGHDGGHEIDAPSLLEFFKENLNSSD